MDSLLTRRLVDLVEPKLEVAFARILPSPPFATCEIPEDEEEEECGIVFLTADDDDEDDGCPGR